MKNSLLLTLIGLLLLGCSETPTTQIKSFGDSTKGVTEKVDAVFVEYNELALNRDITNYASAYSGENAKKITMEDLKELKYPIDEKRKKTFAVYRANKAIGDYATALSELAVAGSRADIDIAASQLYGSMSSMNAQYKTIKDTTDNVFKDEDFALFSRVVAEIGSAVVEEKRNRALKSIVIDADPKIALLCDLVDSQLGSSGIDEGLVVGRNYILTEELKEYRANASRQTSLEWRRAEIRKLYGLKEGVNTSKLYVQNAQKAIRAIKSTHAVLASELAQDRFNSAAIASSVGRLKSLNSHYDDFQDLLMECKKIVSDDKGVLSCNDK